MLQITIKQDETTSVQLFETDKKAQNFLEHLQKAHVKRFGLQKIQSLQKQCYGERRNNLDSEYGDWRLCECKKKSKKELESLSTKPSLLKVEIKHI